MADEQTVLLTMTEFTQLMRQIDQQASRIQELEAAAVKRRKKAIKLEAQIADLDAELTRTRLRRLESDHAPS